MLQSIKSVVKSIAPGLASAWTESKFSRARRAFDSAAPSGPMGFAQLVAMNERYPFVSAGRYDPDTLERRGNERAQKLLDLSPQGASLELGCWDGMVSAAMAAAGLEATAVDVRDTGFDPRARERVALLKMDAAALEFPDDAFDLVFSYDGFEHFTEPDRVFAEALRVTRPGGLVYLYFDPLYHSALGLHAYHLINVPYCQFLFSEEAITKFCEERWRKTVNFRHVNGWHVAQFRAIFKGVETLKYVESINNAHLDLVRSYPGCFKRLTDDFDDLVVSGIEAVFRKS